MSFPKPHYCPAPAIQDGVSGSPFMFDVQGLLEGTHHINVGLGDIRVVSGASLTLGDLSISLRTSKHTHTHRIQTFSELDKIDHTVVQKGHRNNLKV